MSKRRLRLSLRTLLIVVTLLCVTLGYWTYTAKRQEAAVRVIEGLGGTVWYDTAPRDLRTPKLLLDALGVHYFTSVSRVQVAAQDPDRVEQPLAASDIDALVQAMRRLPGAHSLTFSRVDIADDDFARLAPLAPQIEEFSVAAAKRYRRQFTGAGLKHLGGWPRLKTIVCESDKLADDSLAALESMPRLEALYIAFPRLTERHFDHIAAAPALKKLELYHLDFDGESLTRLRHAAALGELNLNAIIAHHPNGQPYHTPTDDHGAPLAGVDLDSLRFERLYLVEEQPFIADTGQAAQQMLPGVKVSVKQ